MLAEPCIPHKLDGRLDLPCLGCKVHCVLSDICGGSVQLGLWISLGGRWDLHLLHLLQKHVDALIKGAGWIDLWTLLRLLIAYESCNILPVSCMYSQ